MKTLTNEQRRWLIAMLKAHEHHVSNSIDEKMCREIYVRLQKPSKEDHAHHTNCPLKNTEEELE